MIKLAYWISCLCVIPMLFLTACKAHVLTIQEKVLKQLNPTVYEFNVPLATLKTAISNCFDVEWKSKQGPDHGGSLLWRESNADALAKDVFSKPGDENDAFLSGLDSSVGLSRVYFKDGEALEYFADFHLHIHEINPNKTRLEIFTYGSRVSAGMESRPLRGPALILVDVEPTTIEEYEILQMVGQRLGVKDMPQLRVPDSDAPVREIQYKK